MKTCPICQRQAKLSTLECSNCGYLFRVQAAQNSKHAASIDPTLPPISVQPLPKTQQKEFRSQATFGTTGGILLGLLAFVLFLISPPMAIGPAMMSVLFWRLAARGSRATQRNEAYSTVDRLISFQASGNGSTATFERLGTLDVPPEFTQQAQIQREYQLSFTPDHGIVYEWRLLPEVVLPPTSVPDQVYQQPIAFPLTKQQRRWFSLTLVGLVIATGAMIVFGYGLLRWNWFELAPKYRFTGGGLLVFISMLPLATAYNHWCELQKGTVFIQTLKIKKIIYHQSGDVVKIRFESLPDMRVLGTHPQTVSKNQFYTVTYSPEAKYIWSIQPYETNKTP